MQSPRKVPVASIAVERNNQSNHMCLCMLLLADGERKRVCHPRKACHHHAKGHSPAGTPQPQQVLSQASRCPLTLLVPLSGAESSTLETRSTWRDVISEGDFTRCRQGQFPRMGCDVPQSTTNQTPLMGDTLREFTPHV